MTAPLTLPRLEHADSARPMATSSEVDVVSLFDEHAPWMSRVAQRLTGSAADADDVVQEVFVLVTRRREELDVRLGIRTWLYRAVVNVARHQRRSRTRHDRMIDRFAEAPGLAPAGVETLMDRRRHAECVRACVARLPELQREVFVLFELEEVPGPQIALILEIPEGTVWSRLSVARQLFRGEWRRLVGGER